MHQKAPPAGGFEPTLVSALADAADLLPTQAIIENFVHHNPLHHFEDEPFHEAVADASRAIGMVGYPSEAYFEARLGAGAITADALRSVLEAAMPTLPPLPPRLACRGLDALVNMFTAADMSDTVRLRRVLMTRLPKLGADTDHYDSAAARVSQALGFDPRPRVNEALSELAASFLDRGASPWGAPHRNNGFVAFFAWLETTGAAGWRSWAREQARALQTDASQGLAIAEAIYACWGVPRSRYAAALRTALTDLPGWAGMFARMEGEPIEAPAKTKVALIDYVVVHAILTESSLRSAAAAFARIDAASSEVFGRWVRGLPSLAVQRQAAATATLLADVTRLFARNAIDGNAASAWSDDEIAAAVKLIRALDGPRRRALWLEALERSYARELITGITIVTAVPPQKRSPPLQVFTCIDDRAESFRRYIEADADAETFGMPGFFGLAVTYRPSDGREPMRLCPLGVVPTHAIEEVPHPEDEAIIARWAARRRLGARIASALSKGSRSPFTSIVVATLLLPLVLLRLLLETMAPSFFSALRRAFNDLAVQPGRTQLIATHADEDAAKLLAVTFHDIGLTEHFAPLVVVLGHGSHSFNNPYFAAYDCGACSGRHGGPNARLFAQLANKASIRRILAESHGVRIPDTTWFSGGNHNTAADVVTLFDSDRAPPSHTEQIARAEASFAKACGTNALERCRRFLLANVRTEAQARAHVKLRSEDASEVRPELNHATNAATIIGRRWLTQGLFMDRRAFMSSYDPLHDDARGTHLERVIAPGLIVCSGINLEYYFSATDPAIMGAGTKAPLNVVGHIGVLQGAYGDLRPGLPTQMTEMHTPVRSLFIVDAPLERLHAVLERRPDLKCLVYNEWVKMAVRDPDTGLFSMFERGVFRPFEDAPADLPRPKALQPWFIGRSADLPVAIDPMRDVA